MLIERQSSVCMPPPPFMHVQHPGRWCSPQGGPVRNTMFIICKCMAYSGSSLLAPTADCLPTDAPTEPRTRARTRVHFCSPPG